MTSDNVYSDWQTSLVIFFDKTIYHRLMKMSAFDWSMTRWYNTHATGW
jgi:hypothetical protein